MRGKRFLTILIAAATVAALGGALVAVAGADDTGALPEITAPELIACMGDHSRAPGAISGDIHWTNDLFGDLPEAPEHAGLPAESPLFAGGSGRLWAQGGKLRLESQGSGGDQVLVADGAAGTVWTYTFATDTAHLYRVAAGEPRGDAQGGGEPLADAPHAVASPEALTPERVSGMLQAASRFMSVDVAGTTVVAGRDAYLLTMTPAATDTALGKVEAAIDGETYVPLRLDVVAKGHDTPTLSFGFTRVSYAPVDEGVFTFTPPEGAKVERDVLDPKTGGRAGEAGDGAGKAAVRDVRHGDPGTQSGDGQRSPATHRGGAMQRLKKLARAALLTRDEAAKLVDFPLASAREYAARDFRWAYVFDGGMPVNALGAPALGLAGMPGVYGSGTDGAVAGPAGETEGGGAAGATPPDTGPAAVLLYGEGFGSIVLVEVKTAADLRQQLQQLPPVVDTIDLGGTQAQAIVTPLGAVATWERDGVTLVAGGMVSKTDLVDFVTSVR